MATGTREEIRIGQLAIRFLVEGNDSGGSVAIFELDVPAGAKVPIAHSHDAYEETIYGIDGVLTFTLEGSKIEVGPGDALCIPRYFAGSGPPLRQISTPPPHGRWQSSPPASSPRTTSGKSPPSPKPHPAAHPTQKPSPKSCAATAAPRLRNRALDFTAKKSHSMPS
jgi:hypothetical protein